MYDSKRLVVDLELFRYLLINREDTNRKQDTTILSLNYFMVLACFFLIYKYDTQLFSGCPPKKKIWVNFTGYPSNQLSGYRLNGQLSCCMNCATMLPLNPQPVVEGVLVSTSLQEVWGYKKVVENLCQCVIKLSNKYSLLQKLIFLFLFLKHNYHSKSTWLYLPILVRRVRI